MRSNETTGTPPDISKRWLQIQPPIRRVIRKPSRPRCGRPRLREPIGTFHNEHGRCHNTREHLCTCRMSRLGSTGDRRVGFWLNG